MSRDEERQRYERARTLAEMVIEKVSREQRELLVATYLTELVKIRESHQKPPKVN